MALVRGKTLVEQTTKKIIEYITDHQMKPGQQLPTEAEFTRVLKVSRGTLRDAFKVLIARNILEARQGSGTFIAQNLGIPDDPLGLTFIYDDNLLAVDMLDVRMMLEPSIAALAAINATPEQKLKLQELTDYLKHCIENEESYAEEDGQFHTLIAEASGNRVISNLTHILFTSIYKNIALTMNVQKVSNTLYYHERILQAILDGDANLAKMYMCMHLSLLKDFMVNKPQEIENNNKAIQPKKSARSKVQSRTREAAEQDNNSK